MASTSSASLQPQDVEVSSRLLQDKDAIVKMWEARLRRDLPQVRNISEPMLRDELPEWLDNLIAALATPDNHLKLVGVSEFAKNHGRVRTAVNFNLNQLLYEYEVLRQTLFDELEKKETLPIRQRNIILDAIQVSARSAASEFVKLTDDIASTGLKPSRLPDLPLFKRVLMAIFVVSLATVVQRLAWPILQPMAYFLYYPAIVVGCFYGAGLLCIFLSVIFAQYFFAHTVLSLRISDWTEGFRILIFVLNTALIWFVVRALRRSRQEIQFTLGLQFKGRREAETLAAQLSAILDSIPGGLYIGDQNGIFRCNKKALEMLGYKDAEGLKRSISYLAQEIQTKDPLTKQPILLEKQVFWRALTEGKSFSTEVAVTPLGSSEDRIMRSDAAPVIVDGKIIAAIAINTDITDQKRLQLRERGVREEAEDALKDLSIERDLREQFVNTLTHDLRNPLSAAKTSAQMIARQPDLSERGFNLISRVIHSVERVDIMIQDLLDANRIRAGKGLPIEVSDCNLHELVDSVCEEFISIYGDRFGCNDFGNLVGKWSCKDIRRMLENLVLNAIKYGDQEKPISISVRSKEELVEISVHNFGNPIALEDQAKLFQPFGRTRKAEASGKKGWGLGLTLVLGVAQAHMGTVDVRSSFEEGTTFRVTLPRFVNPTSSA